MIYSIYSIRDLKTGFLQPTLDINDASAIRNFEHAVLQNEDSLFFSHPEDYSLFYLGSFDSETGEILAQDVDRTELVSAAECMRRAVSARLGEVKKDGK